MGKKNDLSLNELGLGKLRPAVEAELKRLETQASALRALLGQKRTVSKGAGQMKKRRWTASQKKAASQRMKKYHAEKKKTGK